MTEEKKEEIVTQEQPEEDLLLKLTMPGKSLRIDPKDAPQLPTPESAQQSAPAAQSLDPPTSQPTQAQQPSSQQQTKLQDSFQPRPEVNTVVPPTNTPPPTEEAQEDILRKLTMKPKEYAPVTPTIGQVKEASAIRPPPGMYYQTPEEVRSNKPFVSTDAEIEHVKKMAQQIIGSDMVQNKLRKK